MPVPRIIWEWVGLLRSCSCFEAYCREYTADLHAERIVEFLLFDEEMPRSVRFCIDNIQRDLNLIANATGRTRDTNLARVAGKTARPDGLRQCRRHPAKAICPSS